MKSSFGSESDTLGKVRAQPGPALLTLSETATVLRTTVKVIRSEIRDGNLETIKVGRSTYVLKAPLEQRLKAKITIDVPSEDQIV
jgi:hypothetical protein